MANVQVELTEIVEESVSEYVIHVDNIFKPKDLLKYLNHVEEYPRRLLFYATEKNSKLF